MIVTFQRPIADLRWLLAERKGLSLPNIPGKTIESVESTVGLIDSLRYFGWAERRPAGAYVVFPDDYCFYSAHNALHFIGLGKRQFNREGIKIGKKISLIRRLFISSQSVSARIEFSLTLRNETPPIEVNTLIQLLTSILYLPTKIPSIDPKDNVASASRHTAKVSPLLHQGENLAAHYALATSQWSVPTHRVSTDFVRSCPPVLLIELGHGEIVQRNISSSKLQIKRLDNKYTNGTDVCYCQLPTKNKQKVACWVLSPGIATIENLRNMRLCLLRLHAEIEIINEVLKWSNKDPSPKIDTERFYEYLKYIKAKIFDRTERAQFDQSAIMAAILAIMEKRPDEMFSIKERFDSTFDRINRIIRRGTVAQTINIGPYATIHGSVSIGENINNSYKIVESIDKEQLREDLKAVVDNVAKMVEKIGSIDEKNKVSEQLKAFVEAAKNPKREQGKLDVTSKGLIDAAKTVAAMAGPVITAVRAVLALVAKV